MTALNAISNKLGPHVNAKECFYNLTQSTWRNIQSLELSNRYKEDDDIKHFCGMLDGLAFLPVDRVSDGMDYIKDNTPDGLEDLVDYFDATYLVGYPQPAIWTAIECIKKDTAIVSMHLTLDARGQPLQKRVRRETRDLQKRLRNLCVDFRDGRKTLEEMPGGINKRYCQSGF
ncbi:hypothetical protein Hamer_G024302, partial [Homarus americanus]